MTVLRTGSTPKYADNWDKVFGKGGGKSKKKSATKPKASKVKKISKPNKKTKAKKKS